MQTDKPGNAEDQQIQTKCQFDKTVKVLMLISDERGRQERLKAIGKFKHTMADPIEDDRKLKVLVEEVGEVARAMCDKESKGHLREELIQVAAVCCAWAESLRRRQK